MKFDMVRFYPSINKNSISKSLDFAKRNNRQWNQNSKNQAISILFNQGQIWITAKTAMMKTHYMTISGKNGANISELHESVHIKMN